MGLPIGQFVALGFELGKSLVPEAFERATLRFGVDNDVEPITDTEETTWKTTIETDVFGFDDSEEQKKNGDAESTLRTFLFDTGDAPGAEIDQNGEIQIDELVWQIYRVELIPGKAMAMLFARV